MVPEMDSGLPLVTAQTVLQQVQMGLYGQVELVLLFFLQVVLMLIMPMDCGLLSVLVQIHLLQVQMVLYGPVVVLAPPQVVQQIMVFY